MQVRSWAIAAALSLTLPPHVARSATPAGVSESTGEEDAGDADAPSDSPYPDGDASTPAGEPAASGEDGDAAPEEPRGSTDAPAPEPTPPTPTPGTAPSSTPTTAPPVPSPDPSPDGQRVPAKRLRGALVIARSEDARAVAKGLARAVYRDARLRPAIDEAMAQVLMGAAPDPKQPRQAEMAALLRTMSAVQDDSVRRRLLSSLADDLDAQLVVEVSLDDGGQPRARVLRMPDERFLGMTLTPQRRAPSTEGEPSWVWGEDAIGILRGLLRRPPPGPRVPPPRVGTTTIVTPALEEGDSDWDLLKSPWFWGGLGVVVTVGVTVLILSQTALNEPDVVMLEGRVAP